MRIPLKSAGPAACDCAAGPHQFALSLAANFCQLIVPSTFRGEVNSLRMHSELMSRSFFGTEICLFDTPPSTTASGPP
jgi:hypothetical protein